MSLDRDKIKQFWAQRAEARPGELSRHITNLEEDETLQTLKVDSERRRVFGMLPPTEHMSVLDLASGVGAWSLELATRSRSVLGVELQETMVEAARQEAAQRGVSNVTFVHADVLTYLPPGDFDLVFISGLLLYLPDEDLRRLLDRVAACTRPGALLFLREPVGIPERYEIVDRFSEALQANYSALYRERDELVAMVQAMGSRLVKDGDMFEPGSPLNKWPETRLRVFLFERIAAPPTAPSP